jgi:nitrate/nitrite transport system ATP-binding protein
MEPQILLLDEPLGALDALTRATLQDEIVRIWEREKRTVVLITNDVDEGIYMADRIIPLSAGPGATLGPAVTIDIPRPRDRKELNHDHRFREIRREVIQWLLGPGGKQKSAVSRKLVLPDLVPEDISRGKPYFTFGRRAVRRSEIKRETLEVGA